MPNLSDTDKRPVIVRIRYLVGNYTVFILHGFIFVETTKHTSDTGDKFLVLWEFFSHNTDAIISARSGHLVFLAPEVME